MNDIFHATDDTTIKMTKGSSIGFQDEDAIDLLVRAVRAMDAVSHVVCEHYEDLMDTSAFEYLSTQSAIEAFLKRVRLQASSQSELPASAQ